MAGVPIKRGQTEEEIERYYSDLELRAQEDTDLQGVAVGIFGRYRKGDNPNYIKCCEYGWQGFDAAAAVVHPLMLVYNYIYRYHRDHTPWESIQMPKESHPLLKPGEVYNCLRRICRENQELLLRQFSLTNRQRYTILKSLQADDFDKFDSVYGELTNDQEMSNLCWELGLYHPDEEKLIFSRFLEMPELYDDYLDSTQTEDWEEIEHVPMTNLDVLNRVQDYYDQYCEGRRLLKENGDFINKKEKEIINEILMRPKGDLFRNAYESGIVHLIEYDAETLEVVNIEDYTITSCPPFDDIEWKTDEDPFPFGIKVQLRPTSHPVAPPEAQIPSEDGNPEEVQLVVTTEQEEMPSAPNDKPKKKRRKPSTWLSEKYWMYSDTSVGISLKAKIWPNIYKDLSFLPFPNHGEKRMNGDIKSFGAALLFYVFKQLGIASETATYGRSFERTMIVMGLEAGTLKKNSTAAGPFARNSTVNHLGAISTVIPALCQLRADKRIDIGKIYEGGSELVRVLIDGHNSIMKAYEYLLNELPRIFTETQTTD